MDAHYVRAHASGVRFTMAKLQINRVFIKPEDCTATCLCESELPNGTVTYKKFHEGNCSYQSAVLNSDKLPKTEESLLLMLAAADVCPTDAYFIELEDGTILNVYDDYVQRKIHSKEVEWA